MPIKNYTTKVDVYTSMGEIQGALARAGASQVMVDYAADRKPKAITFGLPTPGGIPAGFRIEAKVEGVLHAFVRDKVKADREQAERTAWRNIRDWVLSQVSLLESEQAELDELFLHRLIGQHGETLYDVYKGGQLLLGGGED